MFAASFAASATDYNLGTLDGSDFDTLSDKSAKFAANHSISDNWSFQLTTTSYTTVSASQAFAVSEHAIANFNGELFNASNVSLGALDFGLVGNTQVLDWHGLLSAGNYYVHFTGDTYVNNIRYQTSVAAAPIPEPETYGMMLGGLALVGVVAARRKAKQAA
ncbi:PEP-CTERM sorting domain-containing protein [Oxalobacteraceae bacterium]|nr:PEP-CTERM sorting domain-containing protein [Oxalobacteraceae bacterium]